MRSIGRKIVTTKCNGQRLSKSMEEWEDFYIEIYGMLTPDSASKFLQKEYADKSIRINNVEFEEHYYKMDLEKFIENSEQVY